MIISGIDNLRVWFESLPENYTSLKIFDGRATGPRPKNTQLYAQQNPDISRDEAWAALEAQFQLYGNSNSIVTVRANTPSRGDKAINTFFRISPGFSSAVSQGIAAPSQSSIEDKVIERAEAMVERIMLNQRVESLEAQLFEKENPTFIDKLGSMLIDQAPELVPAIGQVLANALGKQQQQHATISAPAPPTQTQTEIPNEVPAPIASPMTQEEAEALLTNSLTRINAHFPNENIIDLIASMADWIDSNPVVGKSIVNSTILKK